MKEIFKVGDKVYDYQLGWGKITEIDEDDPYPIDVYYGDITEGYTIDGKDLKTDKFPKLSFREYNLINGGFSQERPKPDLKDGDFIWVSENKKEWSYERFKRWEGELIICYGYQDPKNNKGIDFEWQHYSLEFPYKK